MDTSFVVGWLAGTLLPLGAIWLLFQVGLRRERCFGYNRALLLLAPVVAVGLPLLPRPHVAGWLAPAAGPIVAVQVVALPPLTAPIVQVSGWQASTLLLDLYLLGVLLALGLLAYRYARLWQATRHLPRERRPGYVLAYTGGQLPISSFGRTIFWDDTAGLTPPEATAVLAHELVHVRQGHSADVLWLEVGRALLWFNPFAHLLVPALRLTHELLADWEAMLQVASPADALALAPPYPSLLARLAVRRVAGPDYSPLLQSFAFSFTLTRIAMLQNQLPVRRWKQWLALPLLGGVFLTASQVVAAQTTLPAVPAGAGETQVETKPALKANVIKMLDEKMAPFEQQRRAGQLLSAKQQKAYDYLQQQLKSAKAMTFALPPTPAPPVPYEPYEKGKAPVSITSDGRAVYVYVEQMPSLPGGGGMGAIVQQVQQNLVYPSGPHQEGRVFVSFVVLADGSVSDTKVVKSLTPAYDEAVLAAIQKLPRFVPGKQNGRSVAVAFTVPVTFKEKP